MSSQRVGYIHASYTPGSAAKTTPVSNYNVITPTWISRNKEHSLTTQPFGVTSCDVAIISVDVCNLNMHHWMIDSKKIRINNNGKHGKITQTKQ